MWTAPSSSCFHSWIPMLTIHCFILVTISWHEVSGGFIIPGLPEKSFVKLGDINIGVLMPMSVFDHEQRCSNQIYLDAVHITQALEYSIDTVNTEGFLPGNVTMGFIVLDDCWKEGVAVAQALTFVPQTQCQGQETSPDNSSNVIKAYDVVAVIGSTTSSQSIAVAHLLGPAQIPQVSVYATSDELSNKRLFPYFLRTTSPDRFQFRALFSLMQLFGWSYVSVVYAEGSYGRNGFNQLNDLFDLNGVCLAAVHKVPTVMSDSQAKQVAKSLVEYRNARAVVIIAPYITARKVIYETGKLVPAGTFTWIGSESWASSLTLLQDLGPTLLDTFHVVPITTPVPLYEQYFQQLHATDTKDPWFAEFWDKFFNCSLAKGTCDTRTTIGTSGLPYTINVYPGHLLDAITVLTSALSRILHSPECSGLVKSAARLCVTGPRMLRELLATRLNGYTGRIELDSNGDRLGRYVIKQVVPAKNLSMGEAYMQVIVAEFDSLTNRMTLVKNISWHHLPQGHGSVHPESQCSYPCRAHEARLQQEVTCCWLCQPCRPNERLILSGTRCDPCPNFTWPDPNTTHSTCVSIPPDTLRLDSVMGSVLTVLALFCLVACLLVFVFFYRHRHRRVIKASSKELSFVMLTAITLGYLSMVTLLAPPTDFMCRLNFLLFCVSFTVIYGPLFVRTLRIFRIFEASKRSAQQPRLVGSSHQLFFSFILFSIQVVICGVVMLTHPRWYKLTQADEHERYVELTCDIPVTGLTSFLTYNLLLVASCVFLAFKTRHLPDNFNESRFISMCVSTTLVIFMCFIPAYIVSSQELLKMVMLSLALALNHSVALVFLFLPKIYAVLYLKESIPCSVNNAVSTQDGRGGRSVFASSSVVAASSSINGGHVLAGEKEACRKPGEKETSGFTGVSGFSVEKELSGFPGKKQADRLNGEKQSDGLNGEKRSDKLNGEKQARGLNGEKQADGLNGETQADRLNGEKQANGLNGEKQANGLNGEKQAHGLNGEKQAHGLNGEKQAHGLNGEKQADGQNGEKQADGLNGEKQAAGFTGEKRASGFSGEKEARRFDGEKQADGFTGQKQASGFSGEKQADGFLGKEQASGFSGEKRPRGFSGEEQVRGFNGEEQARGFSGEDQARGLNGEEQARRFNGEEQARGLSGEKQARGFNGEKQAIGFNAEKQARGFNGDEQARGFNGEEQARGFDGEKQARGFNGEEQARGFNGEEQARGFNAEKQARGFNAEKQARGFSGEKQARGFNGDKQARGFDGEKEAAAVTEDRESGFSKDETESGSSETPDAAGQSVHVLDTPSPTVLHVRPATYSWSDV